MKNKIKACFRWILEKMIKPVWEWLWQTLIKPSFIEARKQFVVTFCDQLLAQYAQ